MARLSDVDLLRLVAEVDRDQALAGMEPKARSVRAVAEACHRIGIVFQIGGTPHPEVARVRAAHRVFYRPADIAIGAIHSGLTFHLDLFFSVELPVVFGSVEIDLLSLADATDMQQRRIFAREEDGDRFIRNIYDVADAGGCLGNMHGFAQPTGLALRFFKMACYHNQGMAATLINAYDVRGGIQSALLCAELAIKAALLSIGWSEQELIGSVGHRLIRAIPALRRSGQFDADRLEALLSDLPDFVASRYDEREWSRLETIVVVETSQRILGEIARSISGNSFERMIAQG